MILRNRVAPCTLLVLLPAVFFLTLGTSCGPKPHDAFSSLVQEFLDGYFAARPVTATSIGAHQHDDRLDDLGEEAIVAEIHRLKEFQARLEAFPAGKLSLDDRIDLETLKEKVASELLELEETQRWRRDPLLYTQTIGNGIYLLLARDFAPLDERLRSAASRLEAVPRLVDQAVRNLDHPPRVHTETAIDQNLGNLNLVREDVKRAVEADSALQVRIAEASGPAVAALERFQEFLENDLLPRSDGDFRLGPDLYRRKLACTLQSALTPEEILKRAWSEFFRVREDMYHVALELYPQYFPGDTPRPIGASVEQRVVERVLGRIADEHPTEKNILPFIQQTLADLEAFIIEEDLIELDRSQTLEVTWMPEFSQGVAIAGLESPGPLEKHLKAFYYVMPIPKDWTPKRADSFFREYNDFMTQILTIHEAMPGHYVQIYHANRHPSIVRQVFGSGTFIEGWAVYCERMIVDAGYMDHDPRLKLQQLKFYLRTVINAILDAGIHADRMPEAEALALLTNGGYQERSEAEGKWDRARLTSTQLSTYFVGVQEVLDLREKYRQLKGSEFSLKDFHEALLPHGSPAPKYLEQLLLGAHGNPVTAALVRGESD